MNSGPGSDTVNVGSTRHTPARVTMVARAAPAPSGLKTARWCLSALTSSTRPTIPLTLIITAAKTVSRARVAVPSPPETIRVTISATSITVTATASSSEPNGSPTRWATTSAWWTAASTAPTSTSPTSTSTASAGWRPHVATRTTAATTGTTSVQWRRPVVAVAVMPAA